METPSESVAGKILKRLVADELILESDRQKLTAKLAQGKLSASDWRLALELPIEKEKE